MRISYQNNSVKAHGTVNCKPCAFLRSKKMSDEQREQARRQMLEINSDGK